MGFRNPITFLSDLIADSITGALVRTAAAGERWELSSSGANTLRGYTGHASEIAAGQLTVDSVADDYYLLQMTSPYGNYGSGSTPATLQLLASIPEGGSALPSAAAIYADEFGVYSNTGAGIGSLEFDTNSQELRINGIPFCLVQAGAATTSSITGGAAWETVAAATFPYEMPVAPKITLQGVTSWSGNDGVFYRPASITTTGFSVQAKCAVARTAQTLHWTAVGM